jgi:hypothetical protein
MHHNKTERPIAGLGCQSIHSRVVPRQASADLDGGNLTVNLVPCEVAHDAHHGPPVQDGDYLDVDGWVGRQIVEEHAWAPFFGGDDDIEVRDVRVRDFVGRKTAAELEGEEELEVRRFVDVNFVVLLADSDLLNP